MKLLLIDNQGKPVACLENIEGYEARNTSNVLALLDFLETLIAAAKRNKDGPCSMSSSFA